MKKKLLLLTLLLSNVCLIGQTTGDLFIIGFNTDGDDDLTFVLFSDILPNTTIYFTDRESDGSGGLTSGEGTLIWNSGSRTIKAGTVVVFTDVDNGSNSEFNSSLGTLNETGSFSLPSSSKDGILVFTGANEDSPSTFISAIQIGNDSSVLGPYDMDGITLSNTDLQIGTSIIVFDNSATPDGAIYHASRSSQSNFKDYFSEISDNTNNWTNVVNGDGESLLPFSHEAFTLHSTNWTGAMNSVWDEAGNWDNGIPSSSSSVTIPDVSVSPIIGTGNTIEVGNLIIDSNEILTVNTFNSLTVSGNLTINGDLILNSGSSFILDGTSIGNITSHRNLATTNWYLVASPVNGQTIIDFYTNESPALGSGSGDTQNVAIAPYDNTQTDANNRWSYYTEGQVDGENGDDTTDTFTSARGYSVKMQTTGDITFKGTMNASDFTALDLGDHSGANGTAFNLMGNPYTSYIAADNTANAMNNILSKNTSLLTEETIWIWDQSKNAGTGGYTQYNHTSGFYIAPGQGFFVSANSNSSTFSITEVMQSHQSTETFQRTNNNRPEINLVMTDGYGMNDVDIFYIHEMTTGFDNGYDSSLFDGLNTSFAIYTHAVANGTGKNLGIQSLPNSNFEDMVIPVGVKASSGDEITISATSLNLPTGINVYLEDKSDHSFTLLDNNSNFITMLTEDLEGIGRFYLHTKNKPLKTHDFNLNNISIYKSGEHKLRIVGVQNGMVDFRLYNILGKQVLNTSFEGVGVNDVPLSSLRTGVYIVQLTTETGKLNTKVIIE